MKLPSVVDCIRSGESTYQINGTTCRLKDIHDLLRGSGISNDLYAIIELGMVDDLLQDEIMRVER